MNDELERDELEAWAVDPLGAGFEDRVMAAWDDEAPSAGSRRTVWIAAASLAAAAVLAFVLWPWQGAPSPSAVAVRAGASAQVDHVPGTGRAEQRAGTVAYEVPSGTPFVVHTPAADIAVHGTAFTVEMLTMQDTRRRKFLGAGALALSGAAVAVYVSTGEVEVSNAHGKSVVTAGQTAVASEHVAPSSKPLPVLAKAEPVAKPRPKRAKRITPQQHEDVRRRIQEVLKGEESGYFNPHDEGAEISDERPPGSLDKDYIREVVTEDLVPIARECYESALEDDPDLGGRLVLEFSIVGDESVGGIVDEVGIDEEASSLMHPSLGECMTESTASLLFDPPEGGGKVIVHYPFIFEPEDGAPAE